MTTVLGEYPIHLSGFTIVMDGCLEQLYATALVEAVSLLPPLADVVPLVSLLGSAMTSISSLGQLLPRTSCLPPRVWMFLLPKAKCRLGRRLVCLRRLGWELLPDHPSVL